jgi:hypothetical protein
MCGVLSREAPSWGDDFPEDLINRIWEATFPGDEMRTVLVKIWTAPKNQQEFKERIRTTSDLPKECLVDALEFLLDRNTKLEAKASELQSAAEN